MIGEGAWAKVYTVDRGDGIRVLKLIKLTRMSPESKQMVLKEVEILRTLKHKNVIQYTDVFAIPDHLCLVTEYCNNGDLSQLIEKSKNEAKALPETEVLRLTYSLMQGLNYLHTLGIIHRDIKPANIFLNHINDCIIGDFGLARTVNDNTSGNQMIGSPSYMAPEVYLEYNYDDRVDIWGAGCILFELCALNPPFIGNLIELKRDIPSKPHPRVPAPYSNRVKELIDLMLVKDFNKRLHAKELLPLINNALQSSISSADKYQILKELGSGSWGKVYLVTYNQQYMVMKEVSTKRMDKKSRSLIQQEIEILQSFNSPYVVKYIEGFVLDDKVRLIQEYCSKGDLEQQINIQKKTKTYFYQKVVLYYFKCMVLGLNHVHSKRVIHRDLKPANIFLNEKYECLIGDFGVAKPVSEHVEARTTIGSPLYMAPEIYLSKPYDNKVDIWGLGCILHQLCCLHPPFFGNDMMSLVSNINHLIQKRIPKYFNPKIQKIIDQMLEKDPTKRPSTDMILKSDLWR